MTDIDQQVPAALAALREKAFTEGTFELTGCTSYVQRRLQCGYNRAADILDRLVAQGQLTDLNRAGVRTLKRFNPS